MKIKRARPPKIKFVPITITLESEKEVEMMRKMAERSYYAAIDGSADENFSEMVHTKLTDSSEE